jgi:hypothetical protein
VIWLIEGVLFLMIGFQLRLLMEKSKALPVPEILAAIAIISAIVVIARFLWVFPGTYLPRLASRKIAAREEKPSWKYIVIIGFTGIRGVVSLAVALALPLTLPNGQEFPHRDLILLVTFGVITFTLVGIGLTLPILVRLLGLSEHGQLEAIREREAEIAARREILESARGSLDRIIAERNLPEGLARFLEARHETACARSRTTERRRRIHARNTGRVTCARNHHYRANVSSQTPARRKDHRRNAPAYRARSRSRGSRCRQPREEPPAVTAGRDVFRDERGGYSAAVTAGALAPAPP